MEWLLNKWRRKNIYTLIKLSARLAKKNGSPGRQIWLGARILMMSINHSKWTDDGRKDIINLGFCTHSRECCLSLVNPAIISFVCARSWLVRRLTIELRPRKFFMWTVYLFGMGTRLLPASQQAILLCYHPRKYEVGISTPISSLVH